MVKKETIQKIQDAQDQYWSNVTLNNIIRIKTNKIQTPYITRDAEEFICLLLPWQEIDGFSKDRFKRILRLDKHSPEVQIIDIDRIESIDGKKLKQEQRIWKIQGSKEYTVEHKGDGKYTCTCPQYTFRRKDCKHIKEVKDG
jgi:hypothetical protein